MGAVFLFLNRHAFKLLILWLMVLSILYSSLSIIRHNTFQSGGFDLGLYDQAVWQYAHFQYPYNTVKQRFILGDHLTLTLPLLASLFWLWDDVRMLLLFQAIWVSASAIPIFLLIKNRGFTSLTAWMLSVVYSLFYGIQFLIFFDFHPITIGVGLIPWALYFLETKRGKLFLFFVVLLLLTQENMGIALASLGFIYIFQKRYRKTGLLCIGGGIAASILSVLAIKLLSPVGFEYTPHIATSPVKLILAFFDAEDKRTVWLYSLSWFSFLPLLSPGAMLGFLLDLSQYFITGEALSRMWSPFMHHRAILAPILLLGSLDALAILKRYKIPVGLLSGGMFLIALFLQFHFHFALNKLSKPAYWQQEQWMDNNRRLFAAIPPTASVATAQNLVPHLSHRNEIYLVYPREHDIKGRPCGRKLCWWLDFAGKPEYLAVDLHPNQWVTQLLETNVHFNEAVAVMESTRKILFLKRVGDARLYRITY